MIRMAMIIAVTVFLDNHEKRRHNNNKKKNNNTNNMFNNNMIAVIIFLDHEKHRQGLIRVPSKHRELSPAR